MGTRWHLIMTLATFLLAIYVFFRSVIYKVTEKLSSKTFSSIEMDNLQLSSPSLVHELRVKNLVSSVLGKLQDLEEKVVSLQEKPSEILSGKEELLDASVRRVDALEAELISTKKVLFGLFISEEIL